MLTEQGNRMGSTRSWFYRTILFSVSGMAIKQHGHAGALFSVIKGSEKSCALTSVSLRAMDPRSLNRFHLH